MRQSIKRAAVLGTVATAALAMSPLAAWAGGNSKTCRDSGTCVVDAGNFSGGQLSVDFDVHGTGGASATLLSNGRIICTYSFDAAAPPQSYYCNSVPAGFISASVSGPAGPSNIGVRW